MRIPASFSHNRKVVKPTSALRSIRARLLLGFVTLVLLPAAIIAITAAGLYWHDSTQQVIDQLTSVATLKEAEISTWVDDLQTDLTLQVDEPERAWIEAALTLAEDDPKRVTAVDNLYREWGELASANPIFSEIFLLDLQGRAVLSTDPRQEGTIHLTQPYFRAGQQGPYVQPPFYSISLRQMSVVTAVPVANQQGQPIGVLAGRASMQSLNDIMRQLTGMGQTGETYLVGPNDILLTDTPQMTAMGLIASSAASYVHTQGIHQATEHKLSDSGLYPNYVNIPVIGVYRWLPSLRVALIAEQAQAEAFGPIRTSLLMTGLIALIATALAIFAARSITRDIAIPLGELTGVARRIANGDLNLKAEIDRQDEIGALAAAFNDMTRRLRDTIAQLTQAQQVAQLGNFEFDLRTRKGTWSDQVYAIFGMAPDTEVTLEVYESHLKPDDFGRVMDAVARTVETKRPCKIEHSIRLADGTEKYIYLIGQPVVDAQGQVVKIFGTIQDITQRKRAEIALDEERNLLRTLIDNSPDLIVVKDLEGHFVITNPAHLALLGHTEPSDVLGRTSFDHQPPEIAQAITRDDQQVLQTASPLTNREERVINYQGDPRWFLTTKVPLRDHSGTITGLLGISRDITERRQAEETLRESERRYRSLFQESPIPLWEEDMSACKAIIDQLRQQAVDDLDAYLERHPETLRDLANGIRFIGANRAALAFYQVSDGAEFWNLMDTQWTETKLQKFRLEILALAQGQFSYTGEVGQPRLPTGAEKWVALHIAIPHEYSDTWARVYVSVIDLTREVKAEQALRQLNAELEQRVRERTQELLTINQELESFAYSISHDLRTPLRAINGYSQLVVEDYGELLDDEGRTHLERIAAATRRMGQIIDDLLGLSRVTRGVLTRERVDLSALVWDIARSLQSAEPDRQVEWSIAEGIETRADPRLLRVALENLIGNAWKFTAKEHPAHITFGEAELDARPVYFIRDNGVGFDMAYVDKIFSPFQRLHSSDDFEGTGIGLATVQRIMQRHEGTIWAESEPGQGATFYFAFNLLDP